MIFELDVNTQEVVSMLELLYRKLFGIHQL